MQKSLKHRDIYLRQLKAFQDTEMIKVITGIRRCGKSCLMKLMAEHLRGSGVGDKQIVEMNFESMRFAEMTAKDLYAYVCERVVSGKRMYLFFDAQQSASHWLCYQRRRVIWRLRLVVRNCAGTIDCV